MSNDRVRTLKSGVTVLAAAAILSLGIARPYAEQRQRSDLASLLDLYATGQHNDALSIAENMSDSAGKEMRLLWFTDGREWIDAKPTDQNRRLLVAASFALEVEHVRVERGQWFGGPWQKTKNGGHTCGGRCVMGWAVQCLLDRGAPDEPERAWWLAAIALVQGVHDTGFLYTSGPAFPLASWGATAKLAPQPPKPPSGLVMSALARFPDESRFKLAKAMAQASQYDVTVDDFPRSPAVNNDISVRGATTTVSQGDLKGGLTLRVNGMPVPAVLSPVLEENRARYAERDRLVAELAALSADPFAGIEARVRLGYLLWATGDDARARTELAAAAKIAVDSDQKYLAFFLLGVAARSMNDNDAAAAAFTAALEARPRTQSASLALASIESLRGNGTQAHDLTRRALTAGDADPWRDFLYGNYPKWPALRAALRDLVARSK